MRPFTPIKLNAQVLVNSARTADPGVSANKILFGQVAALEDPASTLGQGMRDGINAAFAEANKAGGVKGRILELVSADDGYEPIMPIVASKAPPSHAAFARPTNPSRRR
jgi:branched-chain amino acid transport system substrate-binding protein